MGDVAFAYRRIQHAFENGVRQLCGGSAARANMMGGVALDDVLFELACVAGA